MTDFVRDPLEVAKTVNQIFGSDLHAKRVLSLANGVVGTVDAAVLSIHAIGRGYARITNNDKKHGVKQTDRLLGNPGIDVVVAERKAIVVALDWTEFDGDDHATLAGYLITTHGRATPLIWMTVSKTTLENKRNDHEYRLIERLHDCVAPDVKLTLLADRGFGDQKLYRFLQTLGWDFAIRFRGAIQVEDADGTRKMANAWVPKNGRALILQGARVTPHTCRSSRCRRRARQEDEGGLVPGDDAVRAQGSRDREAVWPTVHDRRDVSRPEELSIWNGPVGDAYRRNRPARPLAASCCDCRRCLRCSGRRRGVWTRSPDEN